MNKVEELIQQLCPNGVEYKKLGDIAVDIFRGSGIKREEVTETGTPCIRYGEIYTTYDVWFDTCISHTDASKIASAKYFEYGDIGARTKCTNFKANYEAAQNYYLTDVEVYNKLVDDYDKWNAVNGGGNPVVNKLEKVTIDDYIDFDGDGEYFGKEVA